MDSNALVSFHRTRVPKFCLCAPLLVRSLVRSFVHSFVHSFIRSLVCSFVCSTIFAAAATTASAGSAAFRGRSGGGPPAAVAVGSIKRALEPLKLPQKPLDTVLERFWKGSGSIFVLGGHRFGWISMRKTAVLMTFIAGFCACMLTCLLACFLACLFVACCLASTTPAISHSYLGVCSLERRH